MKREEHFGEKINTNGFDKNPKNINTKGRPVSVKAQLKNLLESEGEVVISKEQIKSINEDGSVTINLPTQDHLAMKLLSWSVSNKGNNSLKAIQMVMEQIDGKPNQKVEKTKTQERSEVDYSKYSVEELKQLKSLLKKGTINDKL